MLNIRIDDPEMESVLRQGFGDDTNAIARAFTRFIQQQQIRQDIDISIQQLEAGESTALSDAIREVRVRYE